MPDSRAVAHNLELRVVAEGIKTEDQMQMLKYMGCELGQGYLYCKPEDADSIAHLLTRHQSSHVAPYRQSAVKQALPKRQARVAVQKEFP